MILAVNSGCIESAAAAQGLLRSVTSCFSQSLRWAFVAVFAVAVMSFATAEASAQTRSLKIHFTHTKERAEIVFKRNGRYDQAGLNQLNNILRDWRRNEPTKMDPRLFDLMWEVYQASGSRDYIHVVSAYRSPNTNNMLRSRSSGVAKNSQHTLGKAMDFFLPDVPVKRIREIGMRFQVGGVGFYPNSGSPFIHLDVGSVRAWPRMSRQELIALFPDGKTIHLPPDGRKLAGYDQALADYQRRVGASEIAVAGGGSRNSDGAGGGGGRRNLIAMLFGNNGDEDEDAEAIAAPTQAAAPQRGAPPAAVPQQAAAPQTQIASVAPIRAPVPVARPVIEAVAQPQMAALAPAPAVPVPAAPVPAAPPAGMSMANATLPANGANTPPAAIPQAAAVEPPSPTEAPAMPEVREFADLSGMSVPVPEFVDRSGISVFAANDAPAFDGQEVTDILMAEATPETSNATPNEASSSALQTALVPAPVARPEIAAIAAATGQGTVAAATGAAASAAAPAAEAVAEIPAPIAAPDEIRVASLTPSPRAASDASTGSSASSGNDTATGEPESLANRMAASLGATPLKGSRPTEREATGTSKRAIRTEPKLTDTMVSSWALDHTRLASVSQPVKSPRFVDKQLRAAPEVVYTTGFSAETVEANRFTGAAVNFLSVARFQAQQ
ncbi:ATP/GTP-binding protein [Rhizobium sp. EC-SD404]|nr:ATP/GTP-binding protein [Rhizobium sp. EC-SD404]